MILNSSKNKTSTNKIMTGGKRFLMLQSFPINPPPRYYHHCHRPNILIRIHRDVITNTYDGIR